MLTELWKWPKPLTRAAHCDMFYRLRWLWKNFQPDTYAEKVSNWPEYDHVMVWESDCINFILKCLHLLFIFQPGVTTCYVVSPHNLRAQTEVQIRIWPLEYPCVFSIVQFPD